MELSERAWQLGLLAEPASGAGPRRSPRAAFPSPGPRPRPATLTRRLRRSATEGNGGRKAATHLDYAHPPHALALAHECPRQIVEHSLARRPMMFWQPSLEHLAMWPPRHRCGCQARLWPRTRRHHLRPLGAPTRDPTSSFAAALISPRTWREFRIGGDQPPPRFSGSRSPAPSLRPFSPFSAPACNGPFLLRAHRRR